MARCANASRRNAGRLPAMPIRWQSALGGVDRALAGVDWLKAHPAAVGVAVAVAVAASPKRAWRWTKRAFFVWRGWRSVRNSLLAVR